MDVTSAENDSGTGPAGSGRAVGRGGPLHRLGLEELRARTSLKWRAHPRDVLPLWVAEMDTPLAEPVVAAVQDALRRGDTGYAWGAGYTEAFRDFASARWEWEFEADQAVLVPDVVLGIVEVLKVLTAPGDPVVVNSPVYPPFYDLVEHLGRRVVESPLGPDHRIDFADLEDAFRSTALRTGRAAYLLCSPHNPTGTVHRREELATVIALAHEYGVRLVVDEIHAPLVYDGERHHPLLSMPGSEDAIVLLSASKAWNLAGLKSAIAVAGTTAVRDLRRMPDVASHGASHLGAIAHTAALRDGREWLDALLADLDENRHRLAASLADLIPAVRYRPPQGTYLAWLDCRKLAFVDDPAEVFLTRGRVALSSGAPFGTGGHGHVRLNLATTPEILCDAVRRMAAAV